MILKPGPVIDFLIANQNVREPRFIDWTKVRKSSTAFLIFNIVSTTKNQFYGDVQAKKMLRNLRVKPRHRNMEFKIVGLSEKPCNQQLYVFNIKWSFFHVPIS